MKGKRAEDSEIPEEGMPQAGGESFGTWLRRQREGRQIALREIADASKISLRYLQALEADRFEVLPAAVFAKGFLRQYARYVGLDPEEVVNFYLAARQASESEEEDEEAAAAGAPSSGLLSGWRLALLTLVLLAIVVLLYYLTEWRTAREPGTAAPGARGETERAEQVASEPAAPPAPAAEPAPAAAATAAGDTVEAAATAAEPEGSAPIRVTLDFTGECWVQARVDGARAMAETRIQGESLHLEAERSVELTFGDGGAVGVEVNGMPLPLEGGPGRVVRLEVDLETVRRLEAQTPGAGP